MYFWFIYMYIKQYKVICLLFLVKTDDDKEHLGIFCILRVKRVSKLHPPTLNFCYKKYESF